MKAYEVGAKCGHVGRDYYIEKVFAVQANSGKEAAAIARMIPRVKHDRADAILFVNEIEWDRYEEIRTANDNDPYLCSGNIQEQRYQCQIERIPEKEENEERTNWRAYPPFYDGKKRIRNPKKYMNRIAMDKRLIYEAA